MESQAMQDFIHELHNNPQLKEEVNTAGKAITDQNSKELRQKLAGEMAGIAGRHGFLLAAEDFYQQDGMAMF